MVNKNYTKGRSKEHYWCKKLKEKFGFKIAQRTAGSHSPFDIIAINTECKQIRLIQCKSKSLSDTATQKLRNENKELNGSFEVKFSIV